MQRLIPGRAFVVAVYVLIVAALLMGAGSKKGVGPDPWIGANGETIANSTDGLFDFIRDSDATVTLGASDTVDANTPLVLQSSGTGSVTLAPDGAAAATVGDAATTVVNLISDGGTVIVDGSITSDANDLAWSVVAGADTACTTTCTSACVVGFDDGAADAENMVDCADATADKCLCAGSS